MSFLAPLFLVGAAAVALPILFHLIRRTTREKMPFSSLMFLKPSPPRVTRRSRLENILLLIFRCLVLCLLALGFARPFFQKPMAASAQAGAGKRVVLLVDTSASMQREGLWADARVQAERWLRQSEPADKFALFTFDRQARRVVSFEEWSTLPAGDRVAVARQRLAQATPGWAATQLGHALISAAEILEDANSRGSATELASARQIVVISDFQEGSKLEGLQGFDWPRGVEVFLEPVKAGKKSNAGLQLLAEIEDSSQPGNEILPRVRVVNAADSQHEQFRIGWARPAEGSFAGTAVDAYVPPGQSRVLQAPPPPPGLPAERLLLTGDSEDFDNVVYVVPPKAEQVKVLFLGDDAERDHVQALYYLRRAFQETRLQNVQIVQRSNDAVLAQADLDSAYLAIITDTLPDSRIRTVREFLLGGKTVLFAMKTVTAAQTLARIAGIDAMAAEEANTDGYAMLGRIDFEHPLFAPFADPRYSDFTKIHVWKHRRLDTNQLAGAQVLARFDKGDPALIQVPVGQGSLLVLTTGWQPADSQLALSSKFVPLLYSILEYSGGLKARLAQYVVDDEANLGSVNRASGIAVRKPDGSRVDLPADSTRFSAMDLPGIYTVTSQQATQRFAVNLDSAESKTAPMPLEDLQRLGLPMKEVVVAEIKKLEEKRQHLHATELENRQKLWRWLLVATITVLILETWLAGWLGRRATPAAAQA